MGNLNRKVRTVTVDVEFIRKAVVMRQRQRKFFAGDRTWLAAARNAEKDFDQVLAEICKGLDGLKKRSGDGVQRGLL